MEPKKKHSSSFRDPSGYIFIEGDEIKRLINPIYFKQFKSLMESGFFQKLFNNNLLISPQILSESKDSIVIKPEKIPFITYPYEWSFNMYKEAALLTLKLQKYSLEHGFSLKDASAFNVSFPNGKAIFIDTLSFDFYKENSPWRAFQQFITHFLGPLLLARYHGSKMLKLMSTFIDGMPVGMVSSMLPFKTKLNPFLYTNIHLLAKFESKHNEDYDHKTSKAQLSKKGQLNIIKSLYNFIKNLELKEKTEWGNYYGKTNYSLEAFKQKSTIINQWIDKVESKTLIDIGGNDGTFVRKLNKQHELALICDVDNGAVDGNYKHIKIKEEKSILPFILDVLSPSPGIGLNNKERASFLDRITKFKPDVTLALAVIHHMSLTGNVPFSESAKFFSSFSKYLIIEFPKREDSWVQRLLKTKGEFEEYFDFYNIEEFEKAYADFFDILEQQKILNSERVIYLLKAKNNG